MIMITRSNRATITERVHVEIDEADRPATSGDRKRGSSERRPARIAGYSLAYAYNFAARRWALKAWDSNVLVQQQRQDDTWGEPTIRRLDNADEAALEAKYLPTIRPALGWGTPDGTAADRTTTEES